MNKDRESRLWELGKANPQAVVAELRSEVVSQYADPVALYLQGVAYYRMRNWSAARELLQRAVMSKKDYPHAWYYLGLTAEQQNNTRAAVAAYRAAASYHPSAALAPLVHKKLAGLDPDFRAPSHEQPRSYSPPRKPPADPRAMFTDYGAQWKTIPFWMKAVGGFWIALILLWIIYVAWSGFQM